MNVKANRPTGAKPVHLHHSTIDCLARVISQCDHHEQMIKLWEGFESSLYDEDMQRIFNTLWSNDHRKRNDLQKELALSKEALKEHPRDLEDRLAQEREKFEEQIRELDRNHRKNIKKIKSKYANEKKQLQERIAYLERKSVLKTPLDELREHLQFREIS